MAYWITKATDIDSK